MGKKKMEKLSDQGEQKDDLHFKILSGDEAIEHVRDLMKRIREGRCEDGDEGAEMARWLTESGLRKKKDGVDFSRLRYYVPPSGEEEDGEIE